MLDYELQVDFPDRWLSMIPKEKQDAIIAVLKQDPRPSYQNIPDRIYGVEFSGFDVRFTVQDMTLTVCQVVPDFHRESRKGKRIEE